VSNIAASSGYVTGHTSCLEYV